MRAKKVGASSSLAISNLPSHILMEILTRLPIKTIVSSKCVCKSWLHLINDPQFATLHQATSKVELCFHSHYNKAAEYKLYMANFYFPNASQSPTMKLNTLLELPEFSYDPKAWGCLRFFNSCNGLLCYSSDSHEFALIWNPITSELIALPAPTRNKVLTTWRGFGLGFSQKANRFKLLCIMGGMPPDDLVVAKICTIEKGCSWKTVGPCPYNSWQAFGRYTFGAFLQGSLHWIGSHSSHTIIVSFDFEDEKFALVPLPPRDKAMNISWPCSGFGVLADCLFVTEITNQGFNIWLMKEYGVQDSWTKEVSLNFSPTDRRKCRRCLPINYLDNGEILIMDHFACLFLYNPVLKSFRDLGSSHILIRVITYRPNLVLLKDSITASGVHVKSRRASLEHGVMATTPSWWKSTEDGEEERRKRCKEMKI